MTDLTIDLSQEDGPVWVGLDRGLAVRERLELNHREDRVDHIDVLIPMSVYAVSSSFFQGLFGPSVRKCGSIDRFEAKFRFSAPDDLQQVLRGHALMALWQRMRSER